MLDNNDSHTTARRLRVALVGRALQTADPAERAAIDEHFEVVAADSDTEIDLAQSQADLVFVFGGDGTILRAARRMGHNQLPMVGVNLGRLGFLADLTPAAFFASIAAITRGQYRVVEHLMFQVDIERQGILIAHQLGLNETAVLAGEPFTMLDIDLYVDSELVTTYSCDGLIVSTPVGSTAHSLSAGGPILRKELQAFVISPISPHTLTMRPVVDAADRKYEMIVRHPNKGTAVVLDGQLLHHVRPDDVICMTRAAPKFQLVEVAGRSYYRTLREKLGWGGRMRKSVDDGAS